MPGLDASVLSLLNPEQALQRIEFDVKSDFIIAPHYSAVYTHLGNDLWNEVERELRSGNFEPSLPISIDVPKANGLTRPGAILNPKDRLVYQVLVDYVAPTAEESVQKDGLK